MKIGEFAKTFNVTVDTVRYYIELGLLIPVKKGSQYRFDHTCQDDMHLIAELKRFGFTLQEIHKILSVNRITHFTDVQDMGQYAKILIEKNNTSLKNGNKSTKRFD